MRRVGVLVFLVIFLAAAGGASAGRSWYLNVGAGHSTVAYPGQIGDFMRDVEGIGGVETLTAQIDLGLYFPIGSRIAVGPSMSRTSDRLSVLGEHVSFDQYLLGGSAMMFPLSRNHRGPFARGDVGLGWARFRSSRRLYGINMTTDQKLGYLVGGGYAIAPTGGPRILFGGNWARRELRDNEGNYGWSGATSFGVSLLF